MGWLFCSPTREVLIKHLLRDFETGSCTLVDHSVYGNELYAVVKRRDTGERFIVVCLMQGTRGDGHGTGHGSIRWGYKDMDEAMGPLVYNCPERLLAQSDCTDSTSVAWRDQCRSMRQYRNSKARFVAGLKPGDKVLIGNTEAVFERRLEGRHSANLVCCSEHGRYRYKPTQISIPN